jgi:dolichol-phosphate mannosyltransferase
MELYGEKHRYIPALAFMNGFSVTELEVRHCPRKYGKTKYNVFRTFRGLTDLLVLLLERSEARPTYLFGGVGVMSLFSTLVVLILVVVEAASGFRHIAWESAAMLLLLFSVLTTNCIVGAALSEMLLRVRYVLSGRQLYKIREIVGE